ncbi:MULTISPECIES: NTP transferase domain-containing protein [unclassified Microbacterium]|uniref:nucleotidyltransferase family protein n=1 Tax=unclassified Microbacterium TaxID=2609290 RepID=UPI0018E202ED|nr:MULTISPECIES: nucleotidyltransferase family protein [unclassified Microbacterium]
MTDAPPENELASTAAIGVAGLVLAGGAGSRFGGPKALATTPDGTPWIRIAVDLLRSAGCEPVWVALGAEGERAEALVPQGAVIVHSPHWTSGLSATLAVGLAAAREDGAEALVIMPVDTPDASAAAVARIVEAGGARPRGMLVQATYAGVPGHPVLIGAGHFAPLEAALTGDRGARAYLVAHGVVEIECGDLWSGADIDEAPAP